MLNMGQGSSDISEPVSQQMHKFPIVEIRNLSMYLYSAVLLSISY